MCSAGGAREKAAGRLDGVMGPDDCVFCALYAGEGEASTVYRDEYLMAAMTVRPAHAGHVLLFPARHVEDIALLGPAELARLFRVAAELRTAIAQAMGCEGFQLLVNHGAATGQKPNCRHLHVHLIPCRESPATSEKQPAANAPRRELDEAARKIAERLGLTGETREAHTPPTGVAQ